MSYKELIREYRKINQLIEQKRIKEAFEILSKLTSICHNTDFANRLENYRETYRNILTYTFEKGDDPEKQQVFNRLIKSILELSDEVKEEIIIQEGMLSHYKLMERYRRESEFKIEELQHWIKELLVRSEVEITGESVNESADNGSKQTEDDTRSRLSEFFKVFWLNNHLTESHINLLQKSRGNSDFPWYYKSLLVSALTMSLLRHFDIEKVKILFNVYEDQENRVWQRALVGILLVFYIHDNRLSFYPEIEQRIKLLKGNRHWNKTIESTVINF